MDSLLQGCLAVFSVIEKPDLGCCRFRTHRSYSKSYQALRGFFHSHFSVKNSLIPRFGKSFPFETLTGKFSELLAFGRLKVLGGPGISYLLENLGFPWCFRSSFNRTFLSAGSQNVPRDFPGFGSIKGDSRLPTAFCLQQNSGKPCLRKTQLPV